MPLVPITGDCRTETAAVLGRLVAATPGVEDLTSGPGAVTVTESAVPAPDAPGSNAALVTCDKPHGLNPGERVRFVGTTLGYYTAGDHEIEPTGPLTFTLHSPWVGDAVGEWRGA